MENVSMGRYFRTLERLLDCPISLRKSFLNQTRRMAEDFIQGKPDATVQEVSDYLGDPRELAQGFLETLDQDMLERYHRRKKFLLRGCIVVLAVALAAAIVWGLRLRNTQNIEISDTIVIYDGLTYKDTTEEIS